MPRINRLKTVRQEERKAREKLERTRERITNRLKDQLGLATAILTGGTYYSPRVVWYTDEDGERRTRERAKRIYPWWWKDNKGNFYINIWYNNKKLVLPDGTTTILVGRLNMLLETIQAIIDAVQEGELDEAIEQKWNWRELNYYLSEPLSAVKRRHENQREEQAKRSNAETK